MNEIIKDLSKPLNPNDIEVRIGSVSENKGFSLLAYKTARTDIKRLNDVCGTQWKNRFFYDEKKLLCCEILIYDKDIKEWIGRSDVGIESYSDKEKGSYSDARKRAGFSWGIGIELYEFPFIWIQWSSWYQKGGKFVPKVYTRGWKISYKGDDFTKGIIISTENGEIVWEQGKKQPKKKKPEPEQNNTKPESSDFTKAKDKALMMLDGIKGLATDEWKEDLKKIEIDLNKFKPDQIALLYHTGLKLKCISIHSQILWNSPELEGLREGMASNIRTLKYIDLKKLVKELEDLKNNLTNK